MSGQTITILTVDEIGAYVLEHIAASLERAFNMAICIKSWREFSSQPAADFIHQLKCNSTEMLNFLSQRVAAHSGKLLAVTQMDLYSPIFVQLFGEAQLGGTCALMSLYRLRQAGFQITDREVFLSRCEKEAIHEIGHTFGLVHCKDKNCIMHPSSKIADTDEKSSSFCFNCKTRMTPSGKHS